MSRFFFSCLLLLIATLVLIPVAIWYRKRSELIRTIVLAIPNRSDRLCLLAYDTVGAPRCYRNLTLRSAHGEVIWTAELPKTDSELFDAYVSMELGSEGVVAYTWSGFRTTIDLHSGKILSAVFTK